MASLSTYWHTLRHLRPVQLYGRLWFRAYHPRPDISPAPPLRSYTGKWVMPARRKPSLSGAQTFHLLNVSRELKDISDWDDPRIEKLWTYNLHYFDDLNALDASARIAWHKSLLLRWVLENPPGQGTGWDPYPTSLRIVNWIKWALAGNTLPPECLHSLAVQTRWLARRLEFHLLGNHLFANAKALIFAGMLFDGKEATAWLKKGSCILEREVPEQVLPDGGQFERSPMYHALALEDMLDLCNVSATCPEVMTAPGTTVTGSWPAFVDPMRRWLAVMSHPDGEIGFFNDAAMGVAPSLAELEAYAQRLGFPSQRTVPDGVTHLADSGYIRIQREGMVALLDVAPIGPDYLPGHAHADTLSFELSLSGQRILVNSGTSCYGGGPERLRERGTAAHNTVVVDGLNSSEVWGGFRVARRASVHDLVATGDVISAWHDGYRRIGARHRRSFRTNESAMEIIDHIESGKRLPATAFLHFHPAVDVQVDGSLIRAGNTTISFSGSTDIRLVEYHYAPEFNRLVPAKSIEIDFVDALVTRIALHS